MPQSGLYELLLGLLPSGHVDDEDLAPDTIGGTGEGGQGRAGQHGG